MLAMPKSAMVMLVLVGLNVDNEAVTVMAQELHQEGVANETHGQSFNVEGLAGMNQDDGVIGVFG